MSQTGMITVVVQLPLKEEFRVQVSQHDSINEIRQYLLSCNCDRQPYTSFSFAYKGKSITDSFAPLQEVFDLPQNDQEATVDVFNVQLVPEDYNETELRFHIQRTRAALLFPEQNNFDSCLSLNAGLSTFSDVESVVKSEGAKAQKAAELRKQEEELKKKVTDQESSSNQSADSSPAPPQKSSDKKKKKRRASPETDNETEVEANHEPLSGISFAVSNRPVPTATREIIKPSLNALAISSWGPPLPQLRLKGHIMYLFIETRQGKKFHITASKKGFFVNGSTSEKFDATSKLSEEYRTLFELVRKVAPGLLNSLKKSSAIASQFKNLKPSNAFLAAPWYVDSGAIADNSPMFDQGRDQFIPKPENEWGEELQVAREIGQVEDPLEEGEVEESEVERTRRKTADRILKDRMLNKALFDFSAASALGAVDVACGVKAPMSSDVNKDAEIFLDDGIFYSYGFDATGMFTNYGGDEAARVAAGKDLNGMNVVSKLDIPGLAVLGTTVVDYCGRRIVCQTPVPGVLRPSTESITQIQYGMVDHDANTIAASEDFQPIMEKIAQFCRLKKHRVAGKDADGSDKVLELATSVETRGLNGTDGRKYVLDLFKLTPPDLNFLETKASSEYPHKLCLMRSEAVDEWWRDSVRTEESEKKSADKTEAATEEITSDEGKAEEKTAEEKDTQRFVLNEEEVAYYTSKYSLNPDVLADPSDVNAEIREQYVKDRQEVIAASKFIEDKLVPTFVEELRHGATLPLNGQHLTKMMHARGINMRYLGVIAEKTLDLSDVAIVSDIAVQEAIVRAAKHVVNKMLRVTAIEEVSGLVVDIFNAIFRQDSKTKQLRDEIFNQAKIRFGVAFDESSFNMCTLSVFRDLSLVLGLQWNLDTSVDLPTFFKDQKLKLSNILNIVPKVKQSTFKSFIAEEEMRAAELNLGSDAQMATDLVTESLGLYEQIYNVVHPETAQAYSRASAIYRELGHQEIACELSRKAVTLSERTYGVDAPETILMATNLAITENAVGNTVGALYIYEHVLKYWNCVVPAGHPDSAIAMTNIATMFFTLQKWTDSSEWFEKALERLDAIKSDEERAVSREVLKANCRFQLSQAYIFQKMYKEALESMRAAHSIYQKHLGKENASTKEAFKWVEQLVQVLVSLSKNQKVVLQKPDETVNMSTKGAMSEKSIDDLVAYINGASGAEVKSNKKSKKKGRK